MDYPLEIAGAHGRIDAYRAALDASAHALRCAVPYVYNVKVDPANAPWRRETAETTLDSIKAAIRMAESELAVTNP